MTDDTTALATTAVDASRARRDEARQRPDWSLERSLGAVERTVTAVVGHTGDGFGGLPNCMRLSDCISVLTTRSTTSRASY
jgi:hypothetical protein